MRFLWGEELKINVVHVDDVAAAMWIAASESPSGSIYNLADSVDLTQGTFNKWLSELFKIDVSCMGSLISNLAKLNLSGVAEEANDKHVPGFTQLCHVRQTNPNTFKSTRPMGVEFTVTTSHMTAAQIILFLVNLFCLVRSTTF